MRSRSSTAASVSNSISGIAADHNFRKHDRRNDLAQRLACTADNINNRALSFVSIWRGRAVSLASDRQAERTFKVSANSKPKPIAAFVPPLPVTTTSAATAETTSPSSPATPLSASSNSSAASTASRQTLNTQRKPSPVAKFISSDDDWQSLSFSPPAIPVTVLSFRDELDAGTAFKLPPGVRRIIGGYCGLMFQSNFVTDKDGYTPWQLIEEGIPEKLPPLRVGLFLVARDSSPGQWFPAGVVAMHDYIRVHFTGWPAASGEAILDQEYTDRLRPLGSQTVFDGYPEGSAVAHTWFNVPAYTLCSEKMRAAADSMDGKIFCEKLWPRGLDGAACLELWITRYVEVLCVVVEGSPELNRILAIRFALPMSPAPVVVRDTSSIKEVSEGVVAVSNETEGTSLVISAWG